MSSEVKEIVEEGKRQPRIKRLPVPFNRESREILEDFQAKYRLKYGRKIGRADVAGKIFEVLRKANIIQTVEI
jgi:hypothetical protein